MEEKHAKPVSLFIDENVEVYEGAEAESHFQSRNDLAQVDDEYGVTRVGRERWQEAQRYERRVWLDKGRWAFTDRNEQHRLRFAGYAPLQGLRFRRGIELGCGPFTNIRLILEHCAIEQLTLLDPLIDDYLEHTFCRYARGRLGGLFNERVKRLPAYARRPLQFVRSKRNDYRVGGLLGRPVNLNSSMIESYETDQRFDLVVMINVLEHCQDAAAVLHKIDEILRPGGVFVYHDKMYQAQEVKRLATVLYDAGHPLRVDQSFIDAFLARHFTALMRAQYLVQAEFHGVAMSYYDLYYIGKKNSPAS